MKKVLLGLTAALITAGIFTAATAVRENASAVSSAKPVKCAICKGTGKLDYACNTCQGTGKVTDYGKTKPGKIVNKKCDSCKGKRTVKGKCTLCKGTGKAGY